MVEEEKQKDDDDVPPISMKTLFIKVFLPFFFICLTYHGNLILYPIFLRKMFNASDSFIGLAATVGNVGDLCSSIPVGKFIASYGTRQAELMATTLVVLAYVFFSIPSAVELTCVYNFVLCAGFNCFFLAQHTFLTANVPKHISGRVFAFTGGTWQVSGIIGALMIALFVHLSGLYMSFLLLCPIESTTKKISLEKIEILKKQGFVRIYKNGEIININDIDKNVILDFKLVVDRFVVNDNKEFKSRVADSVELAFYEGKGICSIINMETDKEIIFSNKFEADGINFIEPSVHLFSFNNPFGACKNCDGFGETIGIDEELVIPNKALSVYDDAIAPWRGTGLRKYYVKLIDNADKFNFPIYKPYNQLSKNELNILWEGNEYFSGINKFFKYLEKKLIILI